MFISLKRLLFICLLINTTIATILPYGSSLEILQNRVTQFKPIIDQCVKDAGMTAKAAVKNNAWVSHQYVTRAIQREVRFMIEGYVGETNQSPDRFYYNHIYPHIEKRAHEIWDDMAYGIYRPFQYNGHKSAFDN